ncbi:MAG: TetR/AcrR family transcriptional regulator [Dehalococcoidia bacterium]|nr:TetR/AcrR family transcriptional regulator [Dehalococcoidia bacterium]
MIKRDPKATRERIINAAIGVFSQGDFNEATVRDIARKSGVSQANIYQYFDSKESLLFSIIIEESKQMKQYLEQHLSGIKGTENKLRKMTWYYLYSHEQNRQLTWLEFMVLSTKAWSEPPGVWDSTMEVAAIFRDILEEGKQNGEVRQDANIRVIGHLYFGGLRNAIVFWCLDKQFKSLASEITDSLTDFVWKAIKIPPSYTQCPFIQNDKILLQSHTGKKNKKYRSENRDQNS